MTSSTAVIAFPLPFLVLSNRSSRRNCGDSFFINLKRSAPKTAILTIGCRISAEKAKSGQHHNRGLKAGRRISTETTIMTGMQVAAASTFMIAALTVSAAAQFAGRATVIDGDDIELWTDSAPPKRIRLCGIDAPEQGCPGYGEATKELRALVEGKQVRCIQVGGGTPCDGRSRRENRGRIIAQCFVESTDVAGSLVERGFACDWERFSGGHYSRNGKGRACPKDHRRNCGAVIDSGRNRP
jgi:endonuclease YncB( thermonuclease family)